MHDFRTRILRGAAAIALIATGGFIGARSAQAQSEAQALRSFDISAGSLGSAIARLGRQADIMVTVDPVLVRGRHATGLRGSYTPEQALNALLANSGLTARADGKGGFIVVGAPSATRQTVTSRSSRPASAAVVRATDTEPAQTQEGEAIVVTGQKIQRTLLDTQASVGVVTREDILTKDLTSFREAFRMMANVMSGDWLDSGFVIRGINSEGLVPGSPLATTYVDGAEQTANGARRGARGLWDVEQVEVFRGPQSTLTGRAALAGAVYVNTRDPQYDYDAAARLSSGELGTREAAVAFGGPVVDDLVAVRFAAEYQHRDSETSYPDYASFDRYGALVEDKYYQLRGKLRLDPFPGLTATFSHAYSFDSPAYDDVGGPGFGWRYSDRRGDTNLPYYQEVRETRNHSSAARIAYNVTPEITLSSITSLVNTNTVRDSVNAGTAGQTYVLEGNYRERLFTQELRFNYDGVDGLRAVMGLYYNYSRNLSTRILTTPSSGGRTDDTVGLDRRRNYAFFGEVTVPVLKNVSLIAGGRLDYTKLDYASDFVRTFANPALPGATTIYTLGNKETIFLPKAGIDITLSPETKLGFVVQTGWRPGGADRDAQGIVSDFGPEKSITYEGSLRHDLDGRGTVSLNIFYTDWKDQQVRFDYVNPDGSLSRRFANAGKARIYGGEFEGRYRLARDLSTFASIGYINSRFTDFVAADLGDFTGLSLPQSPDWTVAAGLDYRPGSGFFAGGDAKYTGAFIARDMQNAPVDKAGDYLIVNARMGYAFDGLSLMLYAENLFNEQYFTYRNRIDYGAVIVYGSGTIVY
ncbi:MAG: TonB-dependent receptor, partial [Sphingobium sp.]